jgi:hypothetical protein
MNPTIRHNRARGKCEGIVDEDDATQIVQQIIARPSSAAFDTAATI